MRVSPKHAWPRRTDSAIALQRSLAARVRQCPIPTPIRLVAGADAAFSSDGRTVIAGVVALNVRTEAVVEQRVVRRVCRFPYVPGLLSFRELPALIAAFRLLRTAPDAVLCDAHGLAHPRRFGLACHLGLWLQIPTVGCAKSRLCGTFAAPGSQRGARSPLEHRGERIGTVLRTRTNVQPLFVSPGHLCDLASAEELVLSLAIRYRLPTPARLAHALVTAARRSGSAGAGSA